jgi:hypothetical protein
MTANTSSIDRSMLIRFVTLAIPLGVSPPASPDVEAKGPGDIAALRHEVGISER